MSSSINILPFHISQELMYLFVEEVRARFHKKLVLFKAVRTLLEVPDVASSHSDSLGSKVAGRRDQLGRGHDRRRKVNRSEQPSTNQSDIRGGMRQIVRL